MSRQKNMRSRKKHRSTGSGRLIPALILASSLMAAPALAQQVTSEVDGGTGSLRDVLAGASDGASITFAPKTNAPLNLGVINYDQSGLSVIGNAASSSALSGGAGSLLGRVERQKRNSPALRNWLANNGYGGFQAEADKALATAVSRAGLTKISAGSAVFASSPGGEGLNLKNLHFDSAGLAISLGSLLEGGGIVGVSSNASAVTLGSLDNSVFSGFELDAGNRLYGGGIVGADSTVASAAVGQQSDTLFTGLSVAVGGGNFSGGGIVGANSSAVSGTAAVGSLSGSLFHDLGVESLAAVEGGGVVGARGRGGASVGALSGDVFNRIEVNSDGYIRGGGVIGAYSNSASRIGSIQGSLFNDIKVSAASVLTGGVLGAYNNLHGTSGVVGNIDGSVFANVEAKSLGGEVYAGVLYASGLENELVVRDSLFFDTMAVSEAVGSSSYGGAIAIDSSYATSNADGHVLTLEATANKNTLFRNNRIVSGATSGTQTNSIYIGGIGGYGSAADAVLNVKTAAGGLVDLSDPVSVNLHKGGAAYDKFTMNVEGPGNFYWGGDNDFAVGAGSSVNLKVGSRTTLQAGFRNSDSQDNLTVNMEAGSKLLVELAPAAADTPWLTAETVNVEATAAIGVKNDFTYDAAPLRDSRGRSILKIDAGALTGAGLPTLQGGKITVGVYDYRYGLGWVDKASDPDNVYSVQFNVRSKRTYNKEVGASQATMAPGVLATYLPAGTLLHEHMGLFFRDELYNQYSYGGGDVHSLWITPTYAHAKRDGNSRRLAYDLDTYGATLGWDFRPASLDNSVFGLAASFFDQNYDGDHSDVDGKTVMLQAYGGFLLPEDFELMLNLGYGWADYDQKRRVRGQRLSSDYDGNLFNAGVEFARRFVIDECYSVRPFLGYDYMHLEVDGYREKNGNGTYNLRAGGYSQKLHRYRAGVGLDWQNQQGVKLGGEVYYQGLGGDRKAETDIRFVNDPAGTKWVSLADPLEKNNFGLGLSAQMPLEDNMSLGAGYKLGLGKHTTAHQGNLTLNIDF